MRNWVARSVKRGLLEVGHYARALERDRFPGVAVLCYHGVREEERPLGSAAFAKLHVLQAELEAQCRFLRETCHPIGLDDWRRAVAGGASLPARPVLLTFDDGYRSVLTLAKPILERYGIPAVVFVCSEPVEEQKAFWFDSVARTLGEAEVERMKSLRFDEWESVRREAARNVERDDPNAPLTIVDVQALSVTTGIEIGGHTGGHPILGAAAVEQQRLQIVTNKARLEAWTGKPVRAFAYPDGRATDYTVETVKLVEENGFDFAFTMHHGFAGPKEPALERSRFLMLAGVSTAELAHRLLYSWRR